MLGRLFRIYQRYADRHLKLEAAGSALTGADGRGAGRVDRVRLSDNRLTIEGQSSAARVGLALNRTRSWCVPDRPSDDGGEPGFVLDIPYESGQILLRVDAGDGNVEEIPLAAFPLWRIVLARAILAFRFVRDVLLLSPDLWRWKRRGDLGARESVKVRLGLVPGTDACEMSADIFEPRPERPATTTPVTIIMPVHNALDLVRESLDRVLRHTDLPWRLILIEDASTDAAVRPWLEKWVASEAVAGRASLLLNDTNLGFIGSVNRGFEAARSWPSDPVILLNSDALVPEKWAARLVAPLADPSVASVTPLSNDAEILSVPVMCMPTRLHPGAADTLDRVAAGFNSASRMVEVPTGIGFCMALSPHFLGRLPAFDTAFGRGYGEETDWCQKARRIGGRHVVAQDLFVEHRGGISFGSAEKQRLLEKNAAEITRRYPAYDREVQDFIRRDPLNTARLALAVTWAADRQDAPIPVYLAHAMGGGAEKYLRRRIDGDLAAGGAALVIRVGQRHRWHVELYTQQGLTQGLTDSTALLRRLIGLLPKRRIVYSCGVGDRDPSGLPGLLCDLAGKGDAPLAGGAQAVEVLMHDYFPVSPSYNLLASGGTYRGVPRAGGPLADDPSNRIRQPGGETVTLDQWQAAWGALLAQADKITVFSGSSRDIVAEAYPDAARAISVEPHPLLEPVPRIEADPDPGGPIVIGVLGNIGYQKGAAALSRLSRDLARNHAARLVVIGHLDPAWPLARPSVVHGAYRLQDLPGLVARYRIAGWLIPSIWPETFSYVTHEALATGMPVAAFDIGAQGAAVRAAVAAGAPGGVLPPPEAGCSPDLALLLDNLAPKPQRGAGPADGAG